MNRRGFLQQMIRAGVAAMALPAATTYARVWVPKAIEPVRLYHVADYSQCGSIANCRVQTLTVEELEELFRPVDQRHVEAFERWLKESDECKIASKPSSMEPIHWEFPSGKLL